MPLYPANVTLTGDQTVAGTKTFTSDLLIPDEVYGAGWNGVLEPPTKNAVYDKIETIGGAAHPVMLTAGSATLPDGSTNNVAPALSRRQGTQGTRKVHLMTLDYTGADSAAIESAWWTFPLPENYVSGGTLTIWWWSAVANANAVRWQAQVGAITSADADTPLEHALAAAAGVTTNVDATEARRLTKSTPITLTMDSAAAGDLIELVLFRDPGDAADTSTADAEFVAALFGYTA